MTNAESIDAGQHVRQTRHVMDVELQWDRLLELTRGLAPAGHAALQLILPVLNESVNPRWPLLERTGLRPAAVGAAARRLHAELAALDAWTPDAITAALARTAGAADAATHQVLALASVFVIGELTRLPLAEVCALMGRERVLARLRASTDAYASMQMIG